MCARVVVFWISKTHTHTQQRENTSKRYENTPKGAKLRAHVICFFDMCARVVVFWISKTHTQQKENTSKKYENTQKGAKLRAHVICFFDMCARVVVFWISKTHTQQRENTSKRYETHGFRPVSDPFGVSMFSVLPSVSTTKYYSGTRASWRPTGNQNQNPQTIYMLQKNMIVQELFPTTLVQEVFRLYVYIYICIYIYMYILLLNFFNDVSMFYFLEFCFVRCFVFDFLYKDLIHRYDSTASGFSSFWQDLGFRASLFFRQNLH